MSLNIKMLNGDELHKFKTKSNVEYLVIELGDLEERIPHFTDAIRAAMRAAIVSLTTAFPNENNEGLVPGEERDSANEERARIKATKHKEPVDKAGIGDSENAQRVRRRAERLEKLNISIIEDSLWLTANDLSQKTGFKSSNPSAGPNRWKSSGKIFAIQLQGKDFYPEYALDEGFRPLPIIKKIVMMFGDRISAQQLDVVIESEVIIDSNAVMDVIEDEADQLGVVLTEAGGGEEPDITGPLK